MVKIEKLEMQGFKSFAKKTILTFPSNLSVVAGPNGSGKSNICDSICFVIGRTSAKSLRAERMLEMIFNGGKNKKPAEFAKVTLYFDNSDKKFPLEDSSISVSRKVNRRGVSIYKLNGKTVTREKILEVLNMANIHPDGHNIILQGDVTEVIEMSPMERRGIIDEVSGIAEFDEKRNKAQRELMTVEERLKEANIILNERSSLLQKLEHESKAAEEYKVLSVEVDKLRASIAKKKLQEAEKAMKILDDKIAESENSVNSAEKEFQSIEKSLEKDEKILEETGKRLFDRSKDIAIIRETEKIKADILRKKDKIETNNLDYQRLGNIIEKFKIIQQMAESKAVQEVLKLKRTGVYGTLASLSQVPNEYQIAIEIAAGHHLHDIVVNTEETAIDCVKFLKQNRIGRATFLPLDKIRPKESEKKPSGEGIKDFAINLIKFDKKYHNAFSFVFGNTLVVDNIDNAKKFTGKLRCVTLDGDLIEKSGAIIGGFYRPEKRSFETEEIKKYENQRSQLQKEIEILKQDIETLEKQIKELLSLEQKGSSELLESERQREKCVSELEKNRSKRKELYEKRINAQNDLNKIRIQKAKLEAELENVKIEFENYKNTETYDLGPIVLSRKLKESLERINALGPINMKALEEFSQQKTVYEELKSKVDKLTEERDKIFSMIAEIEGRRKETFFQTLNIITERFKQVFNDLMRGEANLYLEEPENLESGLIVEASPEGKRLLNIDSMSGGEKTLTALAFLFAIQLYRPAPFYLLDEIDAALDKANTKKTIELIKKYSETAQFVLITHNDTTVAAGDVVFGVSMSEGESNLVAIRMPE